MWVCVCSTIIMCKLYTYKFCIMISFNGRNAIVKKRQQLFSALYWVLYIQLEYQFFVSSFILHSQLNRRCSWQQHIQSIHLQNALTASKELRKTNRNFSHCSLFAGRAFLCEQNCSVDRQFHVVLFDAAVGPYYKYTIQPVTMKFALNFFVIHTFLRVFFFWIFFQVLF